jgi:hypothetical protein
MLRQPAQIGIGLHVYSDDNGGRLPIRRTPGCMKRPSNTATNILRCPADEEYFRRSAPAMTGDTGDPQTTMAGRNLTKARRTPFLPLKRSLAGTIAGR